MHTLTASLVTGQIARCPICQTPLVGRGVWVVDSLAFCHDCARLGTLRALGLEVDSALGNELHAMYARVHGIFLWNPAEFDGSTLTAAQRHWKTSLFPYLIPESALLYAGEREEDPTLQILAQDRPAYQPVRRRTPSYLQADPDGSVPNLPGFTGP